MSKAEWESRKADDRTAKNADQTEFLAIKFGLCPLDEGVRDDRTAGAMDDFGTLDGSSASEWAVEDSKVDDAVSALADEIARRALLMGEYYPFAKTGNTLSYHQSNSLVYEFCLALSLAPTVTRAPFNRLPPAFERLCRDVVCCFAGSDASGLRTGWPIDGQEERTARFKSVVDIVNRATKEWIWSPRPGMPEDPSHVDVKDLGIDFAVWKLMPDGRRGLLFLLGQCACGDDWSAKFQDLDVPHIEFSWFRPFTVAAPVRVFCIPRHIPNSTYWDEVNQAAGIVFDRARIVMFAEAEQNRDAIKLGAKPPFGELIELVIDDFAVGEPEI